MKLTFEDIPNAEALVDTLEEAIVEKPIRPKWCVPDLALDMVVGQLLLNARGVLHLCSADLPGAAPAVARAAVEGMADALYLGLSPSEGQYAKRGARAAVGSSLALDRVHDGVHAALGALGSQRRRKRSKGQTLEDVATLEEEWAAEYRGAERVLASARQSLENRGGQWHWSGLGREALHQRAAALLDDGTLGPVFTSVYKSLSYQTHSLLSASVLQRLEPDRVKLDFGQDNERNRKLGLSSIQIACLGGIKALEDRFPGAIQPDKASGSEAS